MLLYDVGERIRGRRKALNISQDQLAELASLNRVTVAKYESGKVEPGAQALSRIADALETSVDVLLGRNGFEQEEKEPDDDIMEIREMLRRDPSYRTLFKTANKASLEHVRAATAMLKALEPNDDE